MSWTDLTNSKWVKCGGRTLRVQTGPDHRLPVKQLADFFHVNPQRLLFDKERYEFDKEGFTLTAVEGGDSKDAPIIVSEGPAAG